MGRGTIRVRRADCHRLSSPKSANVPRPPTTRVPQPLLHARRDPCLCLTDRVSFQPLASVTPGAEIPPPSAGHHPAWPACTMLPALPPSLRKSRGWGSGRLRPPASEIAQRPKFVSYRDTFAGSPKRRSSPPILGRHDKRIRENSPSGPTASPPSPSQGPSPLGVPTKSLGSPRFNASCPSRHQNIPELCFSDRRRPNFVVNITPVKLTT